MALVCYFYVQKMKCYQIKKQGVRYVTLTLNKDGLCFSVEPQNKESNTYLGLIWMIKLVELIQSQLTPLKTSLLAWDDDPKISV